MSIPLSHANGTRKDMNNRTTKRTLAVLGIVTLLGGAAWLLRPARSAPLSASLSVTEALSSGDEGFTRVTTPRQFSFPADHGPHEDYKTEWWYYTGNLDTADGRHFGFQLTFFRQGLVAEPPERESNWGARNVYMSHFALTDVSNEKFYTAERFSRDGAGLAGAQADPFRVWTESWEASGSPDSGTRLRANHDGVAIDLIARSVKPPVLQGDAGFSKKSGDPGAASYYYSLTRMETSGTITINGEQVAVNGLSWMDREWSTSILSADQIGWDWFALQFNDGVDFMFFQIRLKDGSIEPLSSGTMIAPDGSATRIVRDDIRIEVLDQWTSPLSGAAYPSRWQVTIPQEDLEVTIEPYIVNQELPLSILYWEGAVKFSGSRRGTPVSGNGYIEMTGYAELGVNNSSGRTP